jgi:CHAD domain-containing protein
MRVAVRRLRAMLTLFDREGTLSVTDQELKELQTRLGAVRELQVCLKAYARFGRREAAGEQPILHRLEARSRDQLRAQQEALRPSLLSWRRHISVDLVRSLQRLPIKGRLGGERMRRRLTKAHARLRSRAREALPSLEMVPAHRLRIAVKKLRYQMELLETALTSKERALLPKLAQLQSLLGDLHDLDVQLDQVQELATGSPQLRDAGDALAARIRHRRGAKAGTIRHAVGALQLK